MKLILATIAKNSTVTLALAVLLIAPFQPLIAQADTPDTAGGAAYYGTANASGTATPASQGFGSYDPSINTQATANANNTSAPPAGSPSGNGTLSDIQCGLFSKWDICISGIVYIFTVGIGSGFAYIAAYFFDWTVALSLNGGIYALNFISNGWTTARDIANMAFLFILLYIAFKIIFQADTSDTMHMLTLVIVIALLVNFSFFFTRLAIDAGNILSIQFYNAIQADPISKVAASAGSLSSDANASLFNNAAGAGNQKDLTASIMGMLNLQGLFNSQSFQNWYSPPAGSGTTGPSFMVVVISLSFLYITAGIMFWLLTVAFVTNGVKFLVRIVVLWFLIIAAPLAFVARAVPKFEGYYKQWQDALIKHAFYPAAFMFMFLILSNFSSQMSQNNNLINGLFDGLSASNAASPVASIAIVAANIFIRLGFVIAMLYIGLKASDKIGVFGAEAANHAGDWVGGRMVGAYGKTSGFIGRNTVGWGAYAVGNSAGARRLEARTGPLGLLGRGLRATTGAIGRTSFDVRGTPGLSGSLPKEAGKAQKGGYETALKERTEAKEKRAKAVEPSEGQKAAALEQAKVDPEINYVATKKSHDDEIKESEDRVGEIDKRMEVLKTAVGETPAGREEKDKLIIEKRSRQASIAMSTRALKALEDTTLAKAKEISGEGLKYEYANTLSTRNFRNLWIPFRASKEAAAKIRKGDSKEKRVLDAAKKELKEIEEAEKKEAGETPKEEKEEPAKEADAGHDEH